MAHWLCSELLSFLCSIYEKLIQFCSIDELGTNYPKVRCNTLLTAREWVKDNTGCMVLAHAFLRSFKGTLVWSCALKWAFICGTEPQCLHYNDSDQKVLKCVDTRETPGRGKKLSGIKKHVLSQHLLGFGAVSSFTIECGPIKGGLMWSLCHWNTRRNELWIS